MKSRDQDKGLRGPVKDDPDRALIEAKNLKKHFSSGMFKKRTVKAVDGVSFALKKGKTLGIVGESGCGKSTIARCAAGLIRPTTGHILFNGAPLPKDQGRLRLLRKKLQIIFQDADGALNPRMKASQLILEPLMVNGLLNGNRKGKLMELLDMVHLTPDLLDRYPGELSGGQRQRIGIARALSLAPDLIIADEAAASLDLLVQAQIVDLIKRLQSNHSLACLYISHNLRLVRTLADTVAVMYLGRFVEMGTTQDVFNHARHPYTQALLGAEPGIDPSVTFSGPLLSGDIPSPFNPPAGCRFHTRCLRAGALCMQTEPSATYLGKDHWVACHYI